MKLKTSFLVVGILLVVLSMVMATQYATTKIGFSYNIVHPSNADIRFIGGDNSSDGIRVLRIDGDNSSGSRSIKVEFGNWSVNQNITYTAAYAIVNEEQFSVDITHINVSVTSGTYSYLQIWLHGNRTLKAEDDATSVFMYDNGTVVNDSGTAAWSLGIGNGDPSNMNTDGTSIDTTWDETAHVRYSTTNLTGYGVGMSGRTVENASDFVWVQISIVPESASTHTGTIIINFEASTHLSSSSSMSVGFQGAASWASGPSGTGSDYGRSVAVDGDGNVYVTGSHESGLDFGGGITVADEGSYGVFVAKYNTAGVVQWASGPSGAGSDSGYSVAVDGDGNVYVVGFQGTGLDFGGGITVADDGEQGVFVAKYL